MAHSRRVLFLAPRIGPHVTPLAEVHLHLYGCLRSATLLELLARARSIDWSRYERAYEQAFGVPSPARTILDRHRRGDPSAASDFDALFVFGDDDAGSFARFQAKFDLITAASRVGVAYVDDDHVPHALDEIATIARAVLDDQARQGIGYAEQRFFFGKEAPLPFVEAGLSRLLEIYRASPTVTARLAASLPREDPFRHFEVVQRLALSELGDALTGVDFCHVEEGHPPKKQRALFDMVKTHNAKNPRRALAILYHVGESFTDKSLESAVRWVHEAAELGAHRLGHAIALGVDPEAYGAHVRRESASERRDQIDYDLRFADDLERFGVRVDRAALERERAALADGGTIEIAYDDAGLEQVRARQRFAMREVARLGAVVEVCPTSNLRIGGLRDARHHPVARFVEEGVPFVVGSDDPGILGTTLRDELEWVAQRLGLGAEQVRALYASAWRHRSEALTGRAPQR